MLRGLMRSARGRGGAGGDAPACASFAFVSVSPSNRFMKKYYIMGDKIARMRKII